MALRAKDLSKKTKSSTTTNEVLILQNAKTAKTSQFPLDDVFPMLQNGATNPSGATLGSALATTVTTPLFVGGGFGSSITGSDKNTLIFKGLRSNSTAVVFKNETLSGDVTKGNVVLDVVPANIILKDCNNTASAFISTVNLASNVGATILPVANGGLGANSVLDKAVLITQDSGTDTVSSLAMTTNGSILVGGSSGPVVTTLTGGTNVTISNSDGAISIAAAIGTISSTLNLSNNNLQLGTGWISNDGSAEGIKMDSSGKIFLGANTPTSYFTSDLNIGGNISIGTSTGNATMSFQMKPCTTGATPLLGIFGSTASGTTNGGGGIIIQPGAGDSNGGGGDLTLAGGLKAGSGTDGSVLIRTGSSGTLTTAITVDSAQAAIFAGSVIKRGSINLAKQVTPEALADSTATLRAEHIAKGLVTCLPTTDRTKATAPATTIISTLNLTVDDDSCDFTFINLAADSSNLDVTLSAGTGVTLVGNMHISSPDTADASIASGSAQFRVRRVSSTTVTLYRLS